MMVGVCPFCRKEVEDRPAESYWCFYCGTGRTEENQEEYNGREWRYRGKNGWMSVPEGCMMVKEGES